MSHALPFADLRVVEFVHMVMGPTCGLVLGDMGAEVIKIEPLEGDHTRKLTASGAGFFPAYNRNKKSLAVDLKSARGKEIVHRLVARADVVTENFRPGAMASLGFGYEALSKENPGLVYCSHKGFLRGPYAHRTALDEMAQMMGGLAYMTGPKGRPLRAGASVNDVMGGVFGAVAVMGALYQRKATGRGQYVESALYENNVFLMAQHMMESLATGRPAVPMPERVRAWAVYDTFTTVEGEQVFVGVVTDTQWKVFCEAFDLPQFLTDPSLATNPQRVEQRGRTIPVITELFSRMSKADLMARFEALGLPFAPIARPEDLFDDPHLNASGGLAPITLPDGTATKVPILPIEMDGHRLGVRLDLPKVGEHTREVLESIGYGAREIDELNAAKVIRLS